MVVLSLGILFIGAKAAVVPNEHPPGHEFVSTTAYPRTSRYPRTTAYPKTSTYPWTTAYPTVPSEFNCSVVDGGGNVIDLSV